MRRRNWLALVFAAASLPGVCWAKTYTVDPDHSSVTFRVRHLFTEVQGRFRQFKGTIVFDPATPETSKVEGTIAPTSVDTDVKQRDDDLRSSNFFDVAKFPEMIFKSTAVERTSETTLNVTGDVTLRGITRPMLLAVSVTDRRADAPAGARYARFRAEGSIKRSEFGMTKFVDVVGDTVDITIRAEAWR